VNTDDLDETIRVLNAMLKQTKAKKDRLAIIDRLLKATAIKYRHSESGKGGKFKELEEQSVG
jgi:hypothetical protein